MKVKLTYLFIPLVSMLLLTGCWDNTELNDRHVVLELALDKAENQNNHYEVTYTIPDVAKLSGQESLAEDVKSAMTTTSPTIVKSVNDMERKMQNTLTFSHIKAVVLGEEILKDKELLKNAIGSFSKNIEFSRGANILAVQGKASEITQSENYQNPVLGLYIMKYFNNIAKQTGDAKQQSLGNMIKEIQDTGITTLPVIAKGDEKNVEISGAAVIKDYQLAGWLDKNEVQGMLFINGEIKEIPIVIQYQGQYLTYIIKNKSSIVDFEENGTDNITVDINIKVQGNIAEGLLTANQHTFSEQEIVEIEELIANKISEQVSKTIQKEKELSADFLELGLKCYRKNPSLWKKYSNNKNGEPLVNMPVVINTTAIVQDSGFVE